MVRLGQGAGAAAAASASGSGSDSDSDTDPEGDGSHDAGEAPLQDGWEEVRTEEGAVYWWHTETNETTWERPQGP